MKKRFLLVLAAVFASVALQAQFIAQMTLLTPHYYPGEVYFVDGHSEEYAEVELPRVGKGKLGVKKNAGDKGHTDIDAANIVGIKIWHKDFPDKKHVLYYVHARKSMMQNEHQWGNPVMGSAWGVIFQCEMYHKIDKKTGDLYFVKFTGGNGPNTPTLYYLVRPELELAELAMVNGSFMAMKKAAAKLFAENEEIATAIKKGKLKGSDMQYILDEMAGDKKAEMPVKVIPEEEAAPASKADSEKAVPETKTDSVSNGVVGDDE